MTNKIQDKINYKEMIKEIFVTGETQMGVMWLMFLLGLFFGLGIRSCK